MNNIKEVIIPEVNINYDIISSLGFVISFAGSEKTLITSTENEGYLEEAREDPERVIFSYGEEMSLEKNNFDIFEENTCLFEIIFKKYGIDYISKLLGDKEFSEIIFHNICDNLVEEVKNKTFRIPMFVYKNYNPSGFFDSFFFFIYNLFPSRFRGKIIKNWDCHTDFNTKLYKNLKYDNTIENIKNLSQTFILDLEDTVRFEEKNTIREGNTVFLPLEIKNSTLDRLETSSSDNRIIIYDDNYSFEIYPSSDEHCYYVRSNKPFLQFVNLEGLLQYGKYLCKVEDIDIADLLIKESILDYENSLYVEI